MKTGRPLGALSTFCNGARSQARPNDTVRPKICITPRFFPPNYPSVRSFAFPWIQRGEGYTARKFAVISSSFLPFFISNNKFTTARNEITRIAFLQRLINRVYVSFARSNSIEKKKEKEKRSGERGFARGEQRERVVDEICKGQVYRGKVWVVRWSSGTVGVNSTGHVEFMELLVKPCPLNLGCRLLAQDLSSLNHLAFSWNGRRVVAGGRGEKSREKDGSTAGKKAVGRRKNSPDPRAHLAPTYPSLPTASSPFFSFLTLTLLFLSNLLSKRGGKG